VGGRERERERVGRRRRVRRGVIFVVWVWVVGGFEVSFYDDGLV
jgi:hypothetical protein